MKEEEMNNSDFINLALHALVVRSLSAHLGILGKHLAELIKQNP